MYHVCSTEKNNTHYYVRVVASLKKHEYTTILQVRTKHSDWKPSALSAKFAPDGFQKRSY